MKIDELNAAIFSNDAEALEKLLKAGTGTNQSDSNEVYPLFHAVNFGSVKTIELLLDHGANINQAGCRGKTPWLLAVESGDPAKIALLRGRGADTKVRNDNGQTGLHYAAMRGREDLFNDLLEHAGEEVSYPDRMGNTILHLAAAWNNPALVKTILAKTAIPVDAQNDDGETALLKALRSRQIAIAATLIAAGCDINLTDRKKVYPLLALIKGFADDYSRQPLFCIKIVENHDSGIKFLLTASKAAGLAEAELHPSPPPTLTTLYNDKKLCHSIIAATKFPEQDIPALKLLKTLLDRGSAVNDADIDGGTPLMLSSQAGHEPFVQYLIAHGADINSQDKNGATPLLAAILAGRMETAALLLDAGADWKIGDKDGHTPRQEAEKQQASYLFESQDGRSPIDAVKKVLGLAEGDKPPAYRELQQALRRKQA